MIHSTTSVAGYRDCVRLVLDDLDDIPFSLVVVASTTSIMELSWLILISGGQPLEQYLVAGAPRLYHIRRPSLPSPLLMLRLGYSCNVQEKHRGIDSRSESRSVRTR